jgi:hypothetical protein
MQQEDHPAHSMPDATEQYAGDVLPFPTSRATPIPGSVGSANRSAMEDIAKRGPSAVDKTNLTVLKPLRPGQ